MTQVTAEPVATRASSVVDQAGSHVPGGAGRVLTTSTTAFTLVFAVCLLTLTCFAWMHLTMVRMPQQESPELARHLEPTAAAAAAR